MLRQTLALGVWFCAALQVLSAVPPAEKLLPENTQMVISIPDFAKAREIYRTAPLAKLWEDPAMKPFRDKFIDNFKEKELGPMEHVLGLKWDNLINLPQGQVTFALIPSTGGAKGGSKPEPGMIFLLDVRDKAAQLRTMLADLKKKWTDTGKPVRVEKIRELEFNVVPGPKKPEIKILSTNSASADADIVKPAEKSEFFIGQSDSLLIIGDSAKIIENILAALSGGGPKTLEESPVFASTHGGMFRQASGFVWINAKPWIDDLRRQDEGVKEIEPETNPFSFKWEKLVSATGLGGLKAVGLNYVNSPEGGEINLAINVPESERVGLFSILAGVPKETRPPNFVPANAVKFQRWRMDGPKAWATLQKSLGEVSGQWLNGLNFFLNLAESSGQLKDPDFSIKKNLIGNIGDDFITYSKAAPAGSTDPASGPSILLIGSPNGEQLASAFKSVFSLMGENSVPKEHEFRGHKVYSLPQPALPGVPSSPGGPRAMNYTASSGYLALSDDAGMIEEFLRSSENQEKSLRDTPGLAEATQRVLGDGNSLFGFSNGAEDMRASLETLKKDPNGIMAAAGLGSLAALASIGEPKTAKSESLFDYNLLPAFEKISNYFYFSVYGGSADQKALRLRLFMPNPPQLGGN